MGVKNCHIFSSISNIWAYLLEGCASVIREVYGKISRDPSGKLVLIGIIWHLLLTLIKHFSAFIFPQLFFPTVTNKQIKISGVACKLQAPHSSSHERRCNFPRQFSLAWIRSCNNNFCPMKKSWSNCKFKGWAHTCSLVNQLLSKSYDKLVFLSISVWNVLRQRITEQVSGSANDQLSSEMTRSEEHVWSEEPERRWENHRFPIIMLPLRFSKLTGSLSCNDYVYDIELPYRHGNLFATKLPSYTLLLDTFWANFITVNLISV